MAFIASTLPLQFGFERALSIALQEKNYLGQWNTKLVSNITALDALSWIANLNDALAQLDVVSALPGMQAYAQTQFGSGTYDVATEFSGMRAALVAIRDWLLANIPSNSITITAGVQVGQSFAPAATAPLKALVVAAIAKIA